MGTGKPDRGFGFNGRDGVIFILSLLSAFSIWMIHSLSQNYTKLVSVPVVAESNLEGRSRTSSNTAVVTARCRTRGFDLLRLERASEKKPITLQVASSDLHERGGDIFYITSSDLNRYVQSIFGDKAGMESFVTDTLEFRFPFENHKRVPVCPVTSIDCKSQYMVVGGLEMMPDSVTVYGEQHHLDNIDRVYTRSFTLSGLSGPVRGDVRLENIRGVRLSANRVDYKLDVRRYVEVRTTMPVKAVNVPRNHSLTIFPSTVTVTFRCAFPVSSQPDADMWFFVDYEDFANSIGGHCIPRPNRIPQDVFSYEIEPEVLECVEGVR